MGARATYQPWSDAERKRLQAYVAKGLSSKEIAKHLERPKASIDAQRAALGVEPPGPGAVKGADPATTRRQVDIDNDTLRKQVETLTEQIQRERKARVFRLGKPRSGKKRGGFCRVTWGDSHGMRVDKAAFAAFVEDLAAINPAEVICMGDAIDCDGFLSTHKAVGYTSLSEYSYPEDIDAANHQWDCVTKAAPRARHDYIEGNHEYRVRTWCRDNATNDAELRFHERCYLPQHVLSCEARGVAFHSRGEQHDGLSKRGTIKRGKCLFVHGDSHAKRAAEVHVSGCAMNVVYGHTHRAEEYRTSTEATGEIGAWNPGCLCERHPMWKHSEPSRWSHGYGLQFIAADGDFLHINVPICNGRSLLRPLREYLNA